MPIFQTLRNTYNWSQISTFSFLPGNCCFVACKRGLPTNMHVLYCHIKLAFLYPILSYQIMTRRLFSLLPANNSCFGLHHVQDYSVFKPFMCLDPVLSDCYKKTRRNKDDNYMKKNTGRRQKKWGKFYIGKYFEKLK